MRQGTWILALGWLAGCGMEVGSGTASIVNGRAAGEGELYGTVAIPIGGLTGDPDTQSTCTGTLIRPNVVLSAAHCFFAYDVNGQPSDVREPLEALEVVAGARSLFAASAEQRYRVTDVRIHPGYDNVVFSSGLADLGPAWDDIALVVTDRNVTQVDVMPLLAPSERSMLTFGRALTISGYGATEVVDGEPLGVGTLMIARVGVAALDETELVASSITGEDTCAGDSGGPAYLVVDEAPRVVGITSRSDALADRLCGDGGIYTLAHAYERWIDDEVGPLGGGCRAGGRPAPLAGALVGLAVVVVVRRRGSRRPA